MKGRDFGIFIIGRQLCKSCLESARSLCRRRAVNDPLPTRSSTDCMSKIVHLCAKVL
uniref:Uncharacterized protein n=1 Tax=Anguilla anguilla TaxID=7936 RepID=A0A0E9UTH1_ANGAN